jgi:hypothetical protein
MRGCGWGDFVTRTVISLVVTPAKATKVVIPAKAGIQVLNGSRALRAISTDTCGWLTHGRWLFFACPKKSHQKKRHPGAAEYFLRFSPESALA